MSEPTNPAPTSARDKILGLIAEACLKTLAWAGGELPPNSKWSVEMEIGPGGTFHKILLYVQDTADAQSLAWGPCGNENWTGWHIPQEYAESLVWGPFAECEATKSDYESLQWKWYRDTDDGRSRFYMSDEDVREFVAAPATEKA